MTDCHSARISGKDGAWVVSNGTWPPSVYYGHHLFVATANLQLKQPTHCHIGT